MSGQGELSTCGRASELWRGPGSGGRRPALPHSVSRCRPPASGPGREGMGALRDPPPPAQLRSNRACEHHGDQAAATSYLRFGAGGLLSFPSWFVAARDRHRKWGGPFSPPQAWGPAWPKQPDLLSLGFTDCGVSHCPQAQATSKLSGKSLHRWERIGTGHLQSTAAGGLPRLPSLLLSAASLPRQTSPAPRSPKPCALRARTAGWDQKVPPHPRAAGPSPRPRSLCDQGCGEWHCRGADDPGYSCLFLLMAPPCLPGSSSKGAG